MGVSRPRAIPLADPPTTTQAADLATYALIAPYYLGVGAVSLVLTLVVALMFACAPKLRRDHAATVVFIVTVCDALYTLKFFVSALAWSGGSDDDRDSFHFIPDNCFTAVAFGQFFGMAAISFNACWVFDFLAVLTNPLRNTAGNLRWYSLFSWGAALVTTVALLARSGHVDSERHTCWLKGDAGISWLFTAPLFAYMALAVASLAVAVVRLPGGSLATLRLRRAVLLRHAAYVIAFVSLWLFPILHAFADPNGLNLPLSLLDACAVSGQAAAMALIRLSEPGALRTLAAALRRTRNTLAAAVGARVYLPAGGARAGGDEDEDVETPIPLAALCPLCCPRAARAAALVGGGDKGRSDAESPLLPRVAVAAPTPPGEGGGGGFFRRGGAGDEARGGGGGGAAAAAPAARDERSPRSPAGGDESPATRPRDDVLGW